VLIFMIDMVELLRLSRRATDISMLAVLWIAAAAAAGLHGDPAGVRRAGGGIGALLSLNRKSELIVMRAGGMSVWQFLRPGLAGRAGARDLRRRGLQSAGRGRTLGGRAPRSRRRSGGRSRLCWQPPEKNRGCGRTEPTGQSVMSARAAADRGLTLAGVIVYQFDPLGRFVERIDAERASLGDGYWELQRASVSRPGRDPETFDTYTVSTYLTRERVGEALGSEIAVSALATAFVDPSS
jgi:lipopolysaccharide export system permease protein